LFRIAAFFADNRRHGQRLTCPPRRMRRLYNACMVQQSIVADDAQAVKLQPPGAGIPWLERALSRIGIWLLCQRLTREAASRWLVEEGQRMLILARALPPEQAARQVLIPRVWGIEDSSRNWSVLMTLDHLVIVNTEIASIIERLAAGETWEQRLSTADVKPRPDQDGGAVERFEECLDEYPRRVAALAGLRTRAKHRHPWFGPLNAHEWHCLAAGHQRIHRRQVECIMQRLAG
jgi:hypothetical protein